MDDIRIENVVWQDGDIITSGNLTCMVSAILENKTDIENLETKLGEPINDLEHENIVSAFSHIENIIGDIDSIESQVDDIEDNIEEIRQVISDIDITYDSFIEYFNGTIQYSDPLSGSTNTTISFPGSWSDVYMAVENNKLVIFKLNVNTPESTFIKYIGFLSSIRTVRQSETIFYQLGIYIPDVNMTLEYSTNNSSSNPMVITILDDGGNMS